jgi:hypothetical protein
MEVTDEVLRVSEPGTLSCVLTLLPEPARSVDSSTAVGAIEHGILEGTLKPCGADSGSRPPIGNEHARHTHSDRRGAVSTAIHRCVVTL